MLAADAELDAWPRGAPALRCQRHQRADAVAVEADERIGADQPARLVDAQKPRRVIARNA